jgi:hypothetical protein
MGAGLSLRGRPAVGEILPNDPNCAEEGGNWPNDIHDPHVLRALEFIAGNHQRA